jgi:hypothetical protein
MLRGNQRIDDGVCVVALAPSLSPWRRESISTTSYPARSKISEWFTTPMRLSPTP